MMSCFDVSYAGPITRVLFFENLIFCSSGPFLRVFFVKTGSLGSILKLPSIERIHGILVLENHNTESNDELKVLVWGKKKLFLVSVSTIENQELQMTLKFTFSEMSDWIYSVVEVCLFKILVRKYYIYLLTAVCYERHFLVLLTYYY
jgi:hypothetical protein